ncbi:methyl-accepting chemotaxis protein [Pseudomonas sp. URIL14HWK12:I9]|nr:MULTISPECIES: methyl-accepting chemotaxis protein [unclassified Pseudomonas]PVZ08821.1 methyl-accepting chemotaxis protein [Pseudomonas sp. URIL14HWK12:I12]PVZ21243.1 methyl-accepting chemotaxis protein [Pseudomonas sp. URIL14HWK12:I10]PVZ30105.1 methyl-accepting chemotaxis protein [Pseudomonas sp. URIL14HWK12:I11]SNZ18840.1 methyl-accepting chemotaxis protein [Pseudomonas sp. URIL14HWK12:I9]
MAAWFGNISVRAKLALGFGVVLALTMILAISAWTSLANFIARTDRVGDVTELQNRLNELRVSRLRYMLSNGDEATAKRTLALFDEYRQHLEQISGHFNNPANVKLLNDEKAQAERYIADLRQMIAADREASAARDQMTTTAKQVIHQVAQAEAAVQALASDDPARQSREQVAAFTQDQLQKVRYEVRGYTNNVTPKTEQTAFGQMDKTQAALKEMQAQHPDERASLDGFASALQAYRQSVERFRDIDAQLIPVRKRMEETGGAMIEANQELFKRQDAQSDVDSARSESVLLVASLLALVLGVIAAWLITRQITTPLAQTLSVVQRIANGDLTHTLTVNRRDEIGALQAAVATMNQTLRQLIGGIRDSVTQIASAAEELSAVTEQTSAGVNSQKVETDQVATAMQEMAATVQEVARNAVDASTAATEADAQARNGDQVVAKAVGQIERLADEVRRSSTAMEELQAESDKIGSVMDVIKAVAEQTNLLALNAAIEAARAGEAGRGFAVVADEVRGLAQRTQKSTEEIETLVAALQSGTQHVAQAMDSSRELTDSSVALTREAGDALSSIGRTVSSIQAMNQQIAAAAEQQSSVADEISRSVVNVREVSEQTAAASEETAASSVELARLGTELQQMVNHFRV